MYPVKKISCILLVCLLTASCGRNNFTEKQMEEWLGYLGFDDRSIFSKPYYNLTEQELIIAGDWLAAAWDNPYAGSYYFFPNHFFMASLGFDFRDDKTKLLGSAMGIWEIKNDTVYARIYLVLVLNTMPNGDEVENYESVSPYEVSLIKMKDIAPAGYTHRNFNRFKLPDDIAESIIEPPYPGNMHFIRTTGTIHFVEYELNYGLFEWLPEIEKNKHTGMDMINDVELIKKYTTNPYWGL